LKGLLKLGFRTQCGKSEVIQMEITWL